MSDRFDFPDFTLIYLRDPASPFELELTVNKGRDKPYDLGDGYGHIAFVVDDRRRRARAASARGFHGDRREDAQARRDAVLARFFFATDPDGYKIEVIQRGGRFA